MQARSRTSTIVRRRAAPAYALLGHALLAALILAAGAGGPALAQDAASENTPAALPAPAVPVGVVVGAALASDDVAALAENLKALKAELEAAATINADEKTRLGEQIDRGLTAATRYDSLRADSARLRAELDGAQERIAGQREALNMRATDPIVAGDDTDADTAPDVAAGEARLADVALSAARQRVKEITEARAALRDLPGKLRTQLATAKGVLDEIEAAIKRPGSDGTGSEAPFASRVAQAVLDARRRARQAEIALLEQRLATFDQQLEYLGAELEIAQQELSFAEAAAQAWQKIVQAQRAKEAAKKTREAKETEAALATLPANVRLIAERATEMARTIADVTRKEGEVTRQLASAEGRLQELRDDLASVQQRVAVAGLNESIGLVLRKQQQRLPTLAKYRSQAAIWRHETSWASGLQIDLDGVRPRFANVDTAVTEILAEADPPLAPVAIAYYRPRVKELVLQIKDLIDPLYAATGRYIRQLGRLDNAERQLVSQAEKFNQLISEHLLWVRSTSAISTATVADTWTALRWVLAPDNWRNVLSALVNAAHAEPWRAGAQLLLVALLLGSRTWLRRFIERQCERTLKIRKDHFGRTVAALLAAVASAFAPAFIFLLLGWQLQDRGQDGAFTVAVGVGLEELAYVVWGLYLLAILLRDRSIGAVQFGWPEAARRSLYRHLRWLTPFILITGFCIWVAEAQDNEATRATLGRVAFIAAMLALSVFLARVLRPSGALVKALAQRVQKGLFIRFQYLWVGLAVAVPISLALLSASGFHYSALQLQHRLQTTAWIILGLVLASESLMRWVTLVKRRAAYQQAVEERLAAMRASRLVTEDEGAADGGEDHLSDEEIVDISEPDIDIEDAEQQAGSVVRAAIGIAAVFGLWAAWADVLPALNSLNEVVMWQSPRLVDGAETQVPVTLVDLAVALLIAILAYVGAKNVPGALELILLNQINLDAGAKYAFSNLLRYVIAGVGITIVFNLLGMEWSRLQWLVAALSVGLGFGLQEIVANFVSGIILLFERPIRVGDVVTVNGATGTVSRIQIRATTLVDFDRKELIMPNKVFITGEVLNWTLSDHSNRILVHVGVAYGSDTRLAMELMLKVSREHPLTMDDPPPVATFEGFGENSLNLVLRSYMASLEGRLATITELHNGINDAFNEAGIEISFPQRDVHLDTASPLTIQFERRASKGVNGNESDGNGSTGKGPDGKGADEKGPGN